MWEIRVSFAVLRPLPRSPSSRALGETRPSEPRSCRSRPEELHNDKDVGDGTSQTRKGSHEEDTKQIRTTTRECVTDRAFRLWEGAQGGVVLQGQRKSSRRAGMGGNYRSCLQHYRGDSRKCAKYTDSTAVAMLEAQATAGSSTPKRVRVARLGVVWSEQGGSGGTKEWRHRVSEIKFSHATSRRDEELKTLRHTAQAEDPWAGWSLVWRGSLTG